MTLNKFVAQDAKGKTCVQEWSPRADPRATSVFANFCYVNSDGTTRFTDTPRFQCF